MENEIIKISHNYQICSKRFIAIYLFYVFLRWHSKSNQRDIEVQSKVGSCVEAL